MRRPSYAHGASSTPLLGATIGDAFRRTVDQFGNREALVVRHQGYRATYNELWEQTTAVARGLLALGVRTGDRVGIWSPNRFEWVVTQLATARIGAILVNINPGYKAAELEYALRQSSVSLLVMSRGFRQADYVAILADVRARCPDLARTLVVDWEWDALLAGGVEVDEAALADIEEALQCDDPINIQYTSGTTGFPKGATLSHHNILNNAHICGGMLHYTEHDRVCVPVPFYHCFGMVLGTLSCVTYGACEVVPDESFDPESVLAAVEGERCTSLYGVPTMFIAELNLPTRTRYDVSSLRTGMMGGAPCPVEVMRRVIHDLHVPEITIICGMTETSPVSTQTAVDDPIEKRVETVGRPTPHAEIKIVDPETGVILPRGAPGEQCTRGYLVMLGYWNNGEATRQAIDSAHWMHTGDLAVMDDDGYVRIVGRIKDMICRGGENIYPREVEEFLHTIPGILDAQVVGVPSRLYGEEVMAWVRLTEGARLDERELVAMCKDRIATTKIPRYWKFVESFPMTVTGKIQKYRMREIAIEELGLGEGSDGGFGGEVEGERGAETSVTETAGGPA